MIDQGIRCLCNATRNQNFEAAYFFQAMPVLGPIISVPTALVSGTMAIVKFAQAVFQKIKNRTPFFESNDDWDWKYGRTPLASAIDLSLICVNNVINICTLGILNNLAVGYVLSQIKCGSDDDDD